MTRLGPGRRSLDRGSTFANRGGSLKRGKGLERTEMKRSSGPARKAKPKPRRVISAASPAQRAKVKDAVSIVSGQGPCDPAHIWDRSLGGCDHPDCVVPITRAEHDAYERGDLDLQPHLIKAKCIRELQHALEHANGSLPRLLHKVTGRRHVPEARAA